MNSLSYATWKTSARFHFKSCNCSLNYYTWKKLALSVSVDANISEKWDNSEAIVATEELKILSTEKLKKFSLVKVLCAGNISLLCEGYDLYLLVTVSQKR